jgi:nucleotide-binding universal stress UspA family protein
MQRVLVLLGTLDDGEWALRAACSLASQLEAEILGLFVEDINLLRLAELPFGREVLYGSLGTRRLDPALMERQLRAQVERARRALQAAAERVRIHWSFRVVRGQVVAEVLTAAPEADLLVLGQQVGSRRPPTGGAQRILPRARPVLVFFDGSEGALRALATAIHIARAEGRDLVVLRAVPDSEKGSEATSALEHRALEHRAAERLRVAGMSPRYQRLTGANTASLIEAVRRARAGILVMPEDTMPLGSQHLQTLLGAIGCPLVLVR